LSAQTRIIFEGRAPSYADSALGICLLRRVVEDKKEAIIEEIEGGGEIGCAK